MQISYVNGAPEPDLPTGYTPLLVAGEQTPYLGKLAKTGPLYRGLVREYRLLFGVGESDYSAEMLEWSCHREEKEMAVTLLFINEEPVQRHGITWFCLKEIGKNASGDYHFLTLDQLILCS